MMFKRDYENAFSDDSRFVPDTRRQQVKKHTLDSDEEDDDDDENNVLDADDIEGEEEGIDRQEGEQKMTAFNMKEEMEEGHFDKDGHFIWRNEKEIRDNWLDNIDWQKIKNSSSTKYKYNIEEKGLGAESDSDQEDQEASEIFDCIATYKEVLQFMQPNETVNKTLKRLGGANMKLSSVERLKRKKAGILHENTDVIKLTELANKILTQLGNMDIYQETYEQIQVKIGNSEKKNKTKAKEAELDMYADDFDLKEKEKIAGPSTSSDNVNNDESKGGQNTLMWEFKWKIEDEEIHGPYTNSQMIKWSKENYFKTGVMVRKFGDSSNFYTSNRIDFELYE